MSKSIQSFFDDHVEEWDTDRYRDETYISRARVALGFLARGGSGRRVLDLGCGTGRQSLALLEFGDTVISADFSPEMARATRNRIRKELPDAPSAVIVADATALPFRPGTFDGVLALGLVGFINNRGKLFRELHNVLTPKGELVCDAGVPEREVLLQALSRWLTAPVRAATIVFCKLTGRPVPQRQTGWYSANFIKHSPLEFERLLLAGGFQPFARGGGGWGDLRIGSVAILPHRVHNAISRALSAVSTRSQAVARHALTYVVASTRVDQPSVPEKTPGRQYAAPVRS